MDLELNGKTALVTGGSRGIGRGIAAALVAEGADVATCARTADELERSADVLRSQASGQRRVLAVSADLTQQEDRERVVRETLDELGRIDILVNNAGMVLAEDTIDDASPGKWRQLFELNVFAAVDLARRVLPGMRGRGWGRIVNVSSENGRQPYPDMIAYSVSKGALDNFSKALSKVCGADGVRVNTISPAFIRTPLVESMMDEMAEKKGVSKQEVIEEFLATRRPHIQLGRPGGIEEVGPLVAFLCSERASFVNGANYRIDGGSVASV